MGEARATQIAVLVIEGYEPPLTFDCQLWKITRLDGTIFGFTSHDEDVTWGGLTYKACKSLQASAIETGAFMDAPGNLDLKGIITDDTITEADLFGGLFDGAQVEIWRVGWQGDQRPVRLTAGLGGTVTQNDQEFELEVLTDRARLEQQALLETITASCRYLLGSTRCGVDLDSLAADSTVTAIASRSAYSSSQRRVFYDTARAEASGYWALGEIVWTSGANAGLSSEVKDFEAGEFILWEPMPYPIAVGDAYTIKPGCDRLAPTCKSKFSNYTNFGGFPDVPGKDALMQTPTAKSS